MGIYLNPDNENFRKHISQPIYVDKTMMIKDVGRFMDTGNEYICISRPRRFGKTITGNMLSAYFSKGCDSRELFSRFKIARDSCFEKKLNKYNVIKIDMNSEAQSIEEKDSLIRILTKEIKTELASSFPDAGIEETDSLARSLLRVYAKYRETFVIIVDEYDVLVRERASEKLLDQYLGFLNGLFKSDTLRPAISLAYLTGILPVVRDKVQSKLNNFYEYTVLDAEELAQYIGFTGEEVRELCDRHGISFEECRLWYDGYRQHGIEIYNPESVMKCIRKKCFGSYWSMTSSYESIAERIRENPDGMKEDVTRMLSGENVDVNVTSYLNTMTSFHTKGDIFTYLIHLGYLAYNDEDRTCRIPNREVRQEWFNAIEIDEEYRMTAKIIEQSRKLLSDTIKGDSEAVAKALDESHIHVSSNRSYNNEDVLQSAIYLSYIYALNEYTLIGEMTAGKGFADMVFIPVKKERPAMIIELKRNSCVESALTQIKEKEYFASLSHYRGKLVFVAINYDEKEKKHSCRVEYFEKE